ncbi:MAG: Asp-tRNA(Asn)/Glu-tRNA(Gln) amidotransferase subunit GatC [Kiritimatiellaeota bacterium]|nr:Asp-tRNA(Asn)/Glu-tRNA(Gln) amidotransferase subunit GatC [Kiritimatiellota bacterium]
MKSRKNEVEAIDVQYVADLARIDLTPDEVARFEPELRAVVAYARQLGELDVDDVEPTAHTIPRANVLREDCPDGSALPRDVVLQNSPVVVERVLIGVPAVIDEGPAKR